MANKLPHILFPLLACALCLKTTTVLGDPALRDPSATAWQLARILSESGSAPDPEEAGRYRLWFGVDGSVAVEAGCRRAGASLRILDAPRLEFGSFSEIPNGCESEPLGQRFIAELARVRSFAYRDGQLFLSTTAEEATIEFSPLPPAEASATVDTLSLVVDDVDVLRGIILARLLEAYAVEKNITVSEAEIAGYLEQMDRQLREDLGDDYDDGSSLSPAEQAESDRIRRAIAGSFIRSWKVNGALHRQFGGRIIYQQMGPEPLEAYVSLLHQAQAAGRFAINDSGLEDSFWAFFRDEQRHTFMLAGSEDESRAFTTPPWQGGE